MPQSDETQLADPRRPDEHPRDPTPPAPPTLRGAARRPSATLSRSLDAPFRDPGTVLAAGGRLRGNNTNVYRTTAGTFGALGTLDGATWRFDYPLGAAASVETALFFSTNFAHDFFYDLGFDEAAGNFQADNFGRGGVGGDALTTLSRANGRNNATFEPAPEGQSPTMSLFLFDGSGCWGEDLDGDGLPDLDGGYDTDVVIHEYHHGVSLRLNPDFTGVEADAIGEGGGDFFAYSLSGNTELAEFSAPPIGIRAVNDKTYADFTCLFFFFCEPHDNGEIWANVLWDLREAFRTDLVGGSEAAGISELHRLYLDGLALSPPSPTMLDLRDAMLQADLLRNPGAAPGGSANHCRMWTAFAGRGMGQNALDTGDTGRQHRGGGRRDPRRLPAAHPGEPLRRRRAGCRGRARSRLLHRHPHGRHLGRADRPLHGRGNGRPRRRLRGLDRQRGPARRRHHRVDRRHPHRRPGLRADGDRDRDPGAGCVLRAQEPGGGDGDDLERRPGARPRGERPHRALPHRRRPHHQRLRHHEEPGRGDSPPPRPRPSTSPPNGTLDAADIFLASRPVPALRPSAISAPRPRSPSPPERRPAATTSSRGPTTPPPSWRRARPTTRASPWSWSDPTSR